MRKKVLITVCFCIISAVTIVLLLTKIKKNDDDATDISTSVPEIFTVDFIDYDNSKIDIITVKKGENAHPPKAPEHEGFIFIGWDKELTGISNDITVCALYKQISFPTIALDNVYISSDEKKVTVKISLHENPGLASMLFDIMYDDVITLEKIDFSTAFGEYITTPEPYTNPQTISLISPFKDIDSSGELAELTFSVRNGDFANEATTANISIMYNKDNTFDSDFNDIGFDTINGKVTIIK